MSKLTDHLARLSERPPDYLLSYAASIRDSMRRWPTQYKWWPPINEMPDLPLGVALQLILNENYEYVQPMRGRPWVTPSTYCDDFTVMDSSYLNSDPTDHLIYPRDLPTDIYWEFSSPQGKYVYVMGTPNVAYLLRDKLPSLTRYAPGCVSYEFPGDPLAVSYETHPYYLLDLSVDDLWHPFYGGLYGTGIIYQRPDGSLLYEYFDGEGLVGPLDDRYVSQLRPTNLDYPLGGSLLLIRDECLPVGEVPNSGSTTWTGYSTGYRSDPSYDRYNTYYMYRRPNGSTFLLPSRDTSSYAAQLVDVALQLTHSSEPSITYEVSPNSMSAGLSDSSSFIYMELS